LIIQAADNGEVISEYFESLFKEAFQILQNMLTSNKKTQFLPKTPGAICKFCKNKIIFTFKKYFQ